MKLQSHRRILLTVKTNLVQRIGAEGIHWCIIKTFRSLEVWSRYYNIRIKKYLYTDCFEKKDLWLHVRFLNFSEDFQHTVILLIAQLFC